MGKFERMWVYIIPIFLVLVLLSWLFRYEITPAAGDSLGHTYFRLDRWTGKVQRCYAGSCGGWQ